MREYPYLKDIDFLMSFVEEPITEQFVKMTILNFNDKPIQSIEGIAQSGSINIDGNSAIRRTANLSVVVDDEDAKFMKKGGLFSLNKKVKIEVGLTNTTNRYTEFPILWFPQGVFVIMGISLSHSTSGLSVSLQLKDKMVFLNGECGGIIPASTAFHELDDINPETGEWFVQKPLITDIIRELVNHFGGEQLGKIIISDIDTRVKKVMKWNKNYPLYRYPKNPQAIESPQFYTVLDEGVNKDNYYAISKGEDMGFVYSDFYFPGELAANAGESVCSVLDKIKSTLGNFEYFYDLNGNFVFQEIKNYLNTTKATVDLRNLNQSLKDNITPQNYIIDKGKGNALYVLDNNKIITSYSSSPQYEMIKNDFVVWGQRENASQQKLAIRYHLAIDKKPEPGNIYTCFRRAIRGGVDNEIINYVYSKAMNFTSAIYFPKVGEDGRIYSQSAENAKYKAYVWKAGEYRELESGESPKPPTFTKDDKTYTYYHPSDVKEVTIKTEDWRSELFMRGVMGTRHGTDSNFYYTELANEWPKLYDLGEYSIDEGKHIVQPGFKKDLDYTGIDYYLDFIDSGAAISEFSIENIGRRTKIISEDKINCIFETDIPDVVILNSGENAVKLAEMREECDAKGQRYSQVPEEIFDGMVQGGTLNSAHNEIRNLLYQHTQYNEGVSVQLLPMYFLEPNTRITLRDDATNIHGDYIINSISLPLDISGNTSLSCSKALAQI